jgi:hypothetical protein
MQELGLHAAEVARRAKSTEATISNWCTDKVQFDHVKAIQLVRIADAVDMDARELLLGAPHSRAAEPVHQLPRVAEAQGGPYASQDLQPEPLTVAYQLVAEAQEALSSKGLMLPPARLAELTQIAYELLGEGLPRAKVLRFVLAAAS